MTNHVRPSKKEYYLNIAKAVSQRSNCLKRRYGAIIVKDDEIIATGYNGSPRGCKNCCDTYEICPRYNKPHNSGDYNDCQSVHAEQNAMLSASRKDMLNATMYLAGFDAVYSKDTDTEQTVINWTPIDQPAPCPICMRMIKNAGITDIIIS